MRIRDPGWKKFGSAPGSITLKKCSFCLCYEELQPAGIVALVLGKNSKSPNVPPYPDMPPLLEWDLGGGGGKTWTDRESQRNKREKNFWTSPPTRTWKKMKDFPGTGTVHKNEWMRGGAGGRYRRGRGMRNNAKNGGGAWSGWDLAKWLERLAVTVLGLIPASSDTVESKGRRMKQCWITYIKREKIQKNLRFEKSGGRGGALCLSRAGRGAKDAVVQVSVNVGLALIPLLMLSWKYQISKSFAL